MAWMVVAWLRGESLWGFEEFIISSTIHGLDQLWLGKGVKVIKGLGKILSLHALGFLFNCSNSYVQIFLLKRLLLGSSFGQ